MERDKVYIALSVLESGDALWYWQLRQRQVWDDPARGQVPVSWCMNPTLCDVLPAIAQWYCENAAPGDTFFAAPSGIGYMLAPYYASRFADDDSERIWSEFVAETEAYCRRMGMRGVELHTDGVAPDALRPTLERFVSGMDGLRFILNDFTRFPSIGTGNADYMVGDTVVFHTLTQYKSWTLSTELANRERDAEVAYLLQEIEANTPAERPAFMSAMVTSWTFFPSWIEELAKRLPREYDVVSADELAGMYLEAGR